MIDLLPSEEQQQIIDSVAGFFERQSVATQPGTAAEATLRIRREMAALGWFGLGLSEADGGSGCSFVEEMLVAHEFGRCLASPALGATVLAAHITAKTGQRETLRSILAGRLGVGIVGRSAWAGDATAAVNLIAAEDAQLLLHWNHAGAGLYDRNAFARTGSGRSLDETVSIERVPQTAARPLAWLSASEAPLPRRAGLLICAQLVGVAAAAKDLAVAYAKERHQFGQPIGAFQSVKHACAQMAVQCEAAYAQTIFAALAVTADSADAGFQYAAAGVLTAAAALDNARTGIQIHGAVGFTADCRAHRYLKRAHLLNWLAEPARAFRAACLYDHPL